jgi:Sigma-70 region 2
VTGEQDVLARRFEAHLARLRGVAYRTLGSASEADDAVREAWLRLSRSDSGNIENLGRWLTTAVARVCLTMLQSRRDEPVGMHLPLNTAPGRELAARRAAQIEVSGWRGLSGAWLTVRCRGGQGIPAADQGQGGGGGLLGGGLGRVGTGAERAVEHEHGVPVRGCRDR